jgi:hypothetical protein
LTDTKHDSISAIKQLQALNEDHNAHGDSEKAAHYVADAVGIKGVLVTYFQKINQIK